MYVFEQEHVRRRLQPHEPDPLGCALGPGPSAPNFVCSRRWRCWAAATATPEEKPRQVAFLSEVKTAEFSGDSRLLVVALATGEVQCLNVDTLKKEVSFNIQGVPDALAIHPTAGTIAVAQGNQIHLIDPAKVKE